MAEVDVHQVEDEDGPSAFLGEAIVPPEQRVSFVRAQWVEVDDRISAALAARPEGDAGPVVEEWLERVSSLRAVRAAIKEEAVRLGVELF